MLENRAIKFQIIIYLDENDTVGLNVSNWVSNAGIDVTRTAITRDRAVTARASFSLVSSIFSNYGTDFPERLNVYNNPRFRAGAIVDIKYWDGAAFKLLDFGGRQRINATGPIDPFSVKVGEEITEYFGIKIQCVQKCERLAYLRSSFDPEIPEGFTLVENYFLGTARNIKDLASNYTRDLSLGNIFTASGDPDPSETTNRYVAHEAEKGSSPLDYAHKILAYNPTEEGKMLFLWQDNLERMRIGLLDRTVPASSSNVLLDERWGLHCNIEEYLLVSDPRPPLAGKIKVTGRHKFAKFKENPIRRAGRNGGNAIQGVSSDPHHTVFWDTYDYNDWALGQRFFQRNTQVQRYKLEDGTFYSGYFSEQKILKTYRFDKKISEIKEWNYSTPKVISGRESQSLPLLVSYKRTRYFYNFAGDLIEEILEEWALPEAVNAEPTSPTDAKLISAGTKTRNHSANGPDYSQARVDVPPITLIGSTLLYQSSSVSNTPEARSQAPEVQEEPWFETQSPVWSIISVIFAGFLLDDRVQVIDVGDLNFSGNLRNLGTIVMMEQVGLYLQRTIAVGYRQVAGRCAIPGQQMHIFEDQEQQKMVWSGAGGDVIELRSDTARYVANLEYIGTMPSVGSPGGAMLTPAANVRRLPNGNVRSLPNGNILSVG
jgi:hypothetical protein